MGIIPEQFGSIWKKNEKYYYFDNLGKGQGIWDSIYEVKDLQILESLSSASSSSSRIREWIKQGKLLPSRGDPVIEAVTYYKKRLLTRKYRRKRTFSRLE